jgi:hypothetical protein
MNRGGSGAAFHNRPFDPINRRLGGREAAGDASEHFADLIEERDLLSPDTLASVY